MFGNGNFRNFSVSEMQKKNVRSARCYRALRQSSKPVTLQLSRSPHPTAPANTEPHTQALMRKQTGPNRGSGHQAPNKVMEVDQFHPHMKRIDVKTLRTPCQLQPVQQSNDHVMKFDPFEHHNCESTSLQRSQTCAQGSGAGISERRER